MRVIEADEGDEGNEGDEGSAANELPGLVAAMIVGRMAVMMTMPAAPTPVPLLPEAAPR